jgi:hypothetical protein
MAGAQGSREAAMWTARTACRAKVIYLRVDKIGNERAHDYDDLLAAHHGELPKNLQYQEFYENLTNNQGVGSAIDVHVDGEVLKDGVWVEATIEEWMVVFEQVATDAIEAVNSLEAMVTPDMLHDKLQQYIADEIVKLPQGIEQARINGLLIIDGQHRGMAAAGAGQEGIYVLVSNNPNGQNVATVPI